MRTDIAINNTYTKLKHNLSSLTADSIWIKHYVNYLLTSIILLAAAIAFFHASLYPTANISNLADSPWTIAQNLVQGKGFTACNNDYFPFCRTASDLTAMRGPVPVMLFAGAMLISPSPLSGVTVEIILYLGTLLLIFTILRQFDDRVALLGAFLWAISLPVIRQMSDDHGEMSAAFFISLGMLFFQKGIHSQRLRHWALSGLFFGISSFCLPVFSGVAIGLGVGLLIAQKNNFPGFSLQRFQAGFVFVAAVFLVITPWVIRNQAALGKPVFGSTLIGYNLFRHNSIVQQPNFQPHYVGPVEANQEIRNLIQNSKLTGTENEAQMDTFYSQSALHIILNHPGNYIELSLYRFLPLWFDFGIKEAYGLAFKPIDIIMSFQQLGLLVAILIGLLRKRSKTWHYTLAAFLFCGAYMAVDAQLSYLVGIMPLLVILAAFSLSEQKSRKIAYAH